LLCQALIGNESRSERPDIIVEPLPGFRVLRDLVVDMDPFLAELKRVGAWLVPNPHYDGVMAKETVHRLWSATTCVLCGICASEQAAAADPHPAAVVRVLRFAHDPRDLLGLARLAALRGPEPDGRFAERLKAVCPKRVDVTQLVRS
jgi:succinate dehydrogenase / fumarate reductase iron-sulfur subunit